MRKLLILSTLAMFAVSLAGCNCCRGTCGGRGMGGGLFGSSSNYGGSGECCETAGEWSGDSGMMMSQGECCQ